MQLKTKKMKTKLKKYLHGKKLNTETKIEKQRKEKTKTAIVIVNMLGRSAPCTAHYNCTISKAVYRFLTKILNEED